MMAVDLSVELSDIAPCQKEIKVGVPQEAIEEEFNLVYGELKKAARVPGFRLGHAPRDLLEQHHGGAAREQVLSRLINRSLDEVLNAQQDWNLVGRPKVTDVKFDPKQPLTYSVHVEVAPKITAGTYKALVLTRPKTQVSEEMVNESLSRLQGQHAELKPVLESRAAVEGDYLLVDVTEEKQGDKPVNRRDVVFPLDLKKDPEGLLKELIGMTPGTQRVLNPKSGAKITLSLKQLKIRELPPLDDAFAKSVGPFDSLDSLKKTIQGNLERELEQSQRQALEQQASEKLLSEWKFDVPPSLVGSQAQRILRDRSMELVMQGVPQSEVEERSKMLSEQAKMDALKQVKLFFIFHQSKLLFSNQPFCLRSQRRVDRNVVCSLKQLFKLCYRFCVQLLGFLFGEKRIKNKKPHPETVGPPGNFRTNFSQTDNAEIFSV